MPGILTHQQTRFSQACSDKNGLKEFERIGEISIRIFWQAEQITLHLKTYSKSSFLPLEIAYYFPLFLYLLLRFFNKVLV